MDDRSGPTPHVFGLLARATYRAQTIPDGYREAPVADPKLAADLRTANAKLFVNESGARVVSFAGSQTFGDAVTDVAQGLGFQTAKYTAAARIGEALRDERVAFTGHSLGGGLARLAGASASAGSATPKDVVTFNPAGVHAKTFAAFGLNPSGIRSNQTDYAHGTDLLQGVNDVQRMPQTGTRVNLGEPGARAVERIFAREDARTFGDPETDGALKAMQTFGAGVSAHGLSKILPLLPSDADVLRNARSAPVQERGHEPPSHLGR